MSEKMSVKPASPWKFELDEIVEQVEECHRDGLRRAMEEYFHGPAPRYRAELAAEGKLYLAELTACVLTGGRRRGLMPMDLEEFRTEAYGILLSTDHADDLERGLTDLFIRILDRIESRGGEMVSETVDRALKAIERRYADQDFDLQALSDDMGLTAGYLGRQFRSETGMRFTEHLTRTRVRAALRLMTRENLRTSEIARAVGYADPHYFARVFRAVTGMRITEARAEIAARGRE